MPFFDDSGVRSEEHKGPLYSAFAVLLDQLERMVALNIAWSVQLVPMLMALAFPAWPAWVRVSLLMYSGLALGPATGTLYLALARACDGELLRLEMVAELLGQAVQPSITRLVPLYSVFGWLALVAALATQWRLFAADLLARLAILLLATCALYWGPLLALRPHLPALAMLAQSARLVWRYPLVTLLTAGAVLLSLALGIISVGGTFLIVPVLVALLQLQLYRHVTALRRTGSGSWRCPPAMGNDHKGI